VIRNESRWIAAHILNVIPYIDEMVFYDGNSTDGTVQIIEDIRNYNEHGHKIMLFKDKDPKNLSEDYTRISNECMWSLSTDFAWFLHPDMYLPHPEQILKVKDSEAVAISTKVRSFGGDPDGKLYEIHGRSKEWKHIYRLRNPNLGCHYFGAYGAWNEDCYFSDITGDAHILHEDHSALPYAVERSGIEVLHFSDVRPYERRVSRMVKCLLNNGWKEEAALERAKVHPRVTFKNEETFKFSESSYPEQMQKNREKYRHMERSVQLVKS
jgi:glycosyltransferase involved in cell wall biosynthesis